MWPMLMPSGSPADANLPLIIGWPSGAGVRSSCLNDFAISSVGYRTLPWLPFMMMSSGMVADGTITTSRPLRFSLRTAATFATARTLTRTVFDMRLTLRMEAKMSDRTFAVLFWVAVAVVVSALTSWWFLPMVLGSLAIGFFGWMAAIAGVAAIVWLVTVVFERLRR